jgi:hypothetical protein
VWNFRCRRAMWERDFSYAPSGLASVSAVYPRLAPGALFFAAPRLVIIVPPRLARDASPRVVM